jgi:hypothetical protein
MIQEFSYTSDAISGVADKLGSALDKTTKSIGIVRKNFNKFRSVLMILNRVDY